MPFKITEEDQETRQAVTASFAVAKEISTDVVISAAKNKVSL